MKTTAGRFETFSMGWETIQRLMHASARGFTGWTIRNAALHTARGRAIRRPYGRLILRTPRRP
jgi:hypothetical protein